MFDRSLFYKWALLLSATNAPVPDYTKPHQRPPQHIPTTGKTWH